ncbi:MAG TPA: ABC-F family ATP-binding cassette domain-containing protein [Acidimicrobiales bacterium]|nr:ABC-F family ATP-binding cassette domain-containing protein [Acidimicrobiales bacterium]
MSIDVAGLSFEYPDGTPSVQDLSFRARAGEVTAVVGPNGVGKTTLLQLIAGELAPTEGNVTVEGELAFMTQNPGFGSETATTVADALALGLPDHMAARFHGVRDLYERSGHDVDAAMALGEALDEWSGLGGYEIEAAFDRITRSVLGQGFDESAERPLDRLSGGERKRLILGSFLVSPVPVLLLDEPDNFLDLNGKAWLERELRSLGKTVLMVSHDRTLLSTAVDRMLVLEHNGSWVHGGTYTTLSQARRERAERLARDLDRWHDEERRLFRFYKTMKQRASISPDLASRANAAQTRWERFRDAGPPQAPPPEREITVRFDGSRSGKVAMKVESLEIPDLFLPFDLTVWNEDRVLLLGENGVGKSTLLKVLRDASLLRREELDHSRVRYGPTARVGYFSQENRLDEVGDHGGTLLELVGERFGNEESARRVLGRYGLAGHVRHRPDELSGGQRARVQLIMLETEQPNVLLLDEPTDNLDLESILAIEVALSELEATLVTISHDRAFARGYNRFVLFDRDGLVAHTEDRELALRIASGSGFSVLDEPGLELLTRQD